MIPTTKQELISWIEKNLSDHVEDMSIRIVRPASSKVLPDMRTGAIYPPRPHPFIEHREPTKVEVRFEANLQEVDR